MGAIVRLTRHGLKGNGKPVEEDPMHGGLKDCISAVGYKRCVEMGRGLQILFGRFGGSVHHRTQDTVQAILSGAGQIDVVALPPDKRLGDENQVFGEFGVDPDRLGSAYNRTGSYIQALKEVLAPEKVAVLLEGMLAVINEAIDSGINTLFGSHDPWIPLLVESITGAEVNVPELGYVDIVRNQLGQLVVIDSNVDGVPLSKLA